MREPRTALSGATVTASTHYTYDAAHRLTRITYPDAGLAVSTPNVTYAYDGAGRRVFMWDGYGPSFYEYDVMGRLKEESSRFLPPVQYEYDLTSRLTRMTSHLGVTSYTYDRGHRLLSVTDPLGHVSQFSYDPGSGQSRMAVLPLGSSGDFLGQLDTHYEVANTETGLLQTRTHEVPGSNLDLWSGTYQFDLSGMIRQIEEPDTAPDHTYTYDETDRLVQD